MHNIKINELDCYRIYQSLRLYFMGNYDWFKYGPSAKISFNSYEKRRDRYIFQKLSKKYTREKFIDFVVANFVYGERTWAGNLLDEVAQDIYLEWQKNQESLYYIFEQDCKFLLSYAERNEFSLFKCLVPTSKESYPAILNCYTTNKFTLESLILLNKTIRILDKKLFDILKETLNDPFWNHKYSLAMKYEPFVKYDSKKAKEIVKKVFGGT